MYPVVGEWGGEGGWKMTILLISRKVLRDRRPVVRGAVESLEVERDMMRQAEMEGVYNGEPGFGFNNARYCCQLREVAGYIFLNFVCLEHMIQSSDRL